MQAIKGIVVHLINVYVSPYVENLPTNDVSMSIFSGE